ncbi:MAG: hypothetical protein KY476_05450 [Planctomycetes bacterium]|nr:hypothetical protein [Planctomycetota bacterium]
MPARRRLPTAGRFIAYGLIAAAVLVPAPCRLFAQAAAKSNSVEEHVTTVDGWRLPITYFPARDKEAPVAILLHTQGENRLVWMRNGLAPALAKAGFAVVTVDLRKHGEAKNTLTGEGAAEPSTHDYKAMVLADLPAVKSFLFKEHQDGQLNMAKTAIIAAGMSAPIAINFAAQDWALRPFNDAPTLAASTPRGQIVKALVLLSPEEKLTGVATAAAIRDLRVVPVFGVLIGHAPTEERNAKKMHSSLSALSGNEKRMLIKDVDSPRTGAELIGRSQQFDRLMFGFLKTFVLDLEIPWANRQSRLLRTGG